MLFEDIEPNLLRIIKAFAKDREVVINFSNFKELDLSRYFDHTDLYDLETQIEDFFFDGEDMIPDNQYSKVEDIINFIKIEIKLREPEEETPEEKE